MPTPFWGTNSKTWDQPKINGQILPGVVHLKQASVKLRVEHTKASGKDGGGTTIRGLEIPRFRFELEIRTKEDHDAWDKLVPTLLPQKDPSQRGVLPVYHPSLARYKIAYCIVEEIGETPPYAGGDLLAFIECLGAIPKKNAPASKPKPKVANAPTVALPDGSKKQVKDIRDYVKRPSENTNLSVTGSPNDF